jgi:hypothetical protein
MRRYTALCALLLAACQAGPDAASGVAPPAAVDPASPPDGLSASLTGRVWMRVDSTGLPGIMRVFLPDSTLLVDSCWETYRLAPWQRGPDSMLTWNEDGIDVAAQVVELGPDALVLRLHLPGGSQEERYRAATTPYLCPDMPG